MENSLPTNSIQEATKTASKPDKVYKKNVGEHLTKYGSTALNSIPLVKRIKNIFTAIPSGFKTYNNKKQTWALNKAKEKEKAIKLANKQKKKKKEYDDAMKMMGLL